MDAAGLFRNPADIAEEDERNETRERPTRPTVCDLFGGKEGGHSRRLSARKICAAGYLFDDLAVLSTGDHRVVCEAERHANRLATGHQLHDVHSDVCTSHSRQNIVIIRLHFSRCRRSGRQLATGDATNRLITHYTSTGRKS